MTPPKLDPRTSAEVYLDVTGIEPSDLVCARAVQQLEDASDGPVSTDIVVAHTDCTANDHDVGQQTTKQAREAGIIDSHTGIRITATYSTAPTSYPDAKFIGGLFPSSRVFLSFNTRVAGMYRREGVATSLREHVFEQLYQHYDIIWAKGVSIAGQELLDDTRFIRASSVHPVPTNWFYRNTEYAHECADAPSEQTVPS